MSSMRELDEASRLTVIYDAGCGFFCDTVDAGKPNNGKHDAGSGGGGGGNAGCGCTSAVDLSALCWAALALAALAARRRPVRERAGR